MAESILDHKLATTKDTGDTGGELYWISPRVLRVPRGGEFFSRGELDQQQALHCDVPTQRSCAGGGVCAEAFGQTPVVAQSRERTRD